MTNEESVDVVERNLTSFRITVEELKTSAAALLDDLETEDDFNVANVWYVEQSEKINDFIEKAVRWISSAKETIEHSLETRSQDSSVHSTTSRRSQSSSRSSSRSIATSRAKEKAKAAELMTRVAMLEKRKELEKKVEKLRLGEQLAVARVREGVFAETESGVKDDLGVPKELLLKASFVQESTVSGSSHLTVSSTYTAPTAVPLNTATNMNFIAEPYGAPVIQTPPEPMQYPRLNPLAPEFHVAEIRQDTEPVGRTKQEPLPSEPCMADIRQSTNQFCDVLRQQNRLTELLASNNNRVYCLH